MKPPLIYPFAICLIILCVYDAHCSLRKHYRPLPQHIQRKITGPVYALIFSGKLPSNGDYLITAIFEGHTGETNLNISVTAFTDNKKSVHYFAEEKFTGNATKVIRIKTGNLVPHPKCHMNIFAAGKLNFNYRGIRLDTESHHDIILLQTDKAVYKPGQTVKIRVVAVNAKLIPIEKRRISLLIRDGKGNIVRQSHGLTKNGILSLTFQLSDEPVLGHWLITANHMHNNRHEHGAIKRIEVAQYVLPSFEVHINVPKVASFQWKEIPITVSAHYTYAKQVKGDLTLYLQDGTYITYVRNKPTYNTNYELRAKFNGEITVEIPMSVFNLNNYNYQQNFRFLAVVKDEATGRIYNKTEMFILYRHEYVFQLMNQNRYFNPDVPYSATFKITTRDGRPVKNNGPPVKVKYGYGWDQRMMTRHVTAVPVNGFIVVDIDTSFTKHEATIFTERITKSKKCYIYYRKVYPPKVEHHSIYLYAEYKNFTENIGAIYKQQKQQRRLGCSLHLKQRNFETEVPKVNEVLNVTLNLGTPLKTVLLELISKKGVIKSEILSPSGLQHNLTIKLTECMTPEIRILAYAICNGTIIAHSIDIPIETKFEEFHIKTNVNETKPGSEIEITVQTKNQATVALLAIDKQTLLLKTGNDLSKTDVDMAMQKQVGCRGGPYFASCLPTVTQYSRYGYSSFYLQHSGLALLSNMVHYGYNNYIYNYAANGGFARARMMNKRRMAGGGAVRSEMAFESTTRKFGAHAMAANEVHLRKYFPETWMWEVKESDQNGKLTLTSKVPDTITSWFISAFSLSKISGIGFSENKTSINVFQPFFVRAALPYSIIRGETVSIGITVYNYFKKQVTAKVTLFNEKKEFQSIGAKESKPISIQVDADDAKTIHYKLKATKVGYIDVKVSAITGEAGDVFLEKLLVKAEGETVYKNKAMLLSLDEHDKEMFKQLKTEIPTTSVPDSERITFTAIGDILGPAINHLQDLLRMPYGCGEQNMINLVPNVVVLDYLKKSGRLTDKIKEKAISHIESGYQRELTYAHLDGSFSAFGRRDLFGSTWLTAFVMKTFTQINAYVPIDWCNYSKSAKFLRTKQASDGSFREEGMVIHKEMQSKSGSNSISLTAYVITAISVNPSRRGNINTHMAQVFLEKAIKSITDLYEIAIVTYALHVLNSNEKDVAFKKLMDASKKSSDFVYWESSDNFASIEITSYALMTILLRKNVDVALPIVRWLISKQNSRGGFVSTQDTVISLEALAMFAKSVNAGNNDLKVSVSANDMKTRTLAINKENALVLQEIIIPKKNSVVNVTVTGKGVCIMQLSYKYNILTENSKSYFGIIYNVEPIIDLSGFILKVCTRNLQGEKSGMAVMEIHLPSGFTVDSDSLLKLKEQFKRVDASNSNTLVTVYFDTITKHNTCVSVSAIREIDVFDLKAAPITIYDYYDKTKSNTIFYDITPKPNKNPRVTAVAERSLTTIAQTKMSTGTQIITTKSVTESATQSAKASTTRSKIIIRDN